MEERSILTLSRPGVSAHDFYSESFLFSLRNSVTFSSKLIYFLNVLTLLYIFSMTCLFYFAIISLRLVRYHSHWQPKWRAHTRDTRRESVFPQKVVHTRQTLIRDFHWNFGNAVVRLTFTEKLSDPTHSSRLKSGLETLRHVRFPFNSLLNRSFTISSCSPSNLYTQLENPL